MPRAKRLKLAKKWLASYRGKNLVRGYKKWFGVSDVCAVVELRMLGANIPDARLEQALRDEQARATQRARRKQKHTRENSAVEWDDEFAFIAGYTEGGAPYGTTWEEMEALEAGSEEQASPLRSGFGRNTPHGPVVDIPAMDDDEDLPF